MRRVLLRELWGNAMQLSMISSRKGYLNSKLRVKSKRSERG
jgi:hypothetical protein